MTDDKQQEVIPTIVAAPSPAKEVDPPTPSFVARCIRIIPDPHSRTPGNEAMDIVEVELLPPNAGNHGLSHFQWADAVRFRVKRGEADQALKLLGLK